MDSCYAIYKTNIGYIKTQYNKTAITAIKVIGNSEFEDEGIKTPLTDKTIDQINEYLSGKRKEFDIPIFLEGTEFQKRVWDELRCIPYGKTVSYKQIAEKIGNKKAYRAVGMANNKNPIMFIVPCHRVIGQNGKLTGYAGGLKLKSLILELEREHNL